MNKKVAIIGGGNLGTAIAEGLIKSGFVQPGHIIITKRNTRTLKHLEEKGIMVSNNNKEAVGYADLVLLCVKPFQVNDVLSEVKEQLRGSHVLVSAVTGVTIEQIEKLVGDEVSIVRSMPNTAIAIQESMTCISYRQVKREQLQYVEDIFNQLGQER